MAVAPPETGKPGMMIPQTF